MAQLRAIEKESLIKRDLALQDLIKKTIGGFPFEYGDIVTFSPFHNRRYKYIGYQIRNVDPYSSGFPDVNFHFHDIKDERETLRLNGDMEVIQQNRYSIRKRVATGKPVPCNLKTNADTGVGYLYLIHAAGTDDYKIGVAKDVKKRLAGLQIATPIRLDVVETKRSGRYKKDEAELHHRFRSFHKRGEWFTFDEKILKRVLKYYKD